MTAGTAPSDTDDIDSASRGTSRLILEYSGLAATAVFALFMAVFLLADWYRHLPIAGASMAAFVVDQILIIGEWIDYFLGTDVFWLTSTWRSIATGVFIGIAAPALGAFIVHRQMALIGETLAHAAFAGVAVGVIVVTVIDASGWLSLSSGHILYVALVVSAAVAVGLQWLTEHTEASGDVPIAIVLSGSFAVGTLLITWSRDFATVYVDVEGFLFGSLAIVTETSARLMAVLTVIVVVVIGIYYKQFVFITFDERAARVAGLPVTGFNMVLILLTAIVVVGAMQILGVILVAAMLVVPAATASLLANSFRETMYLSILFGQLSVIAGLAVAIIGGLPPGGSIVVVGIAIYLLAVVYADRSASGMVLH